MTEDKKARPLGELSPIPATERAPTIVCCDLWPPGTLTEDKMSAYKRLIDLGDIRIRRVIHHKATGYTTVDYWSNLPHAWTLNRLRELASLLDQGTQTTLDLTGGMRIDQQGTS